MRCNMSLGAAQLVAAAVESHPGAGAASGRRAGPHCQCWPAQCVDMCCRALPSSLLLLSRAIMVPGQPAADVQDQDLDQLRSTLSSLPDKVIAGADLEKLAGAAE